MELVFAVFMLWTVDPATKVETWTLDHYEEMTLSACLDTSYKMNWPEVLGDPNSQLLVVCGAEKTHIPVSPPPIPDAPSTSSEPSSVGGFHR